MEEDFETLISGFIENNIGISEHFLSDTLSDQLHENIISLQQQGLLNSAGIGNEAKHEVNSKIRSDKIYWLDTKHENKPENQFLQKIDDFIKHLNISCYAGITASEFHYSLYENGDFYKKHLDQFKNNSSRQYTLISYLNANWREANGGELLIHPKDKDQQKISPTQGKTIFFKSSELEHEVLKTNVPRLSVCGWLKRG